MNASALDVLLGYLGPIENGIWSPAGGLHHVVVDGHQVGLWSKRRWAERDLRQHLRFKGRES